MSASDAERENLRGDAETEVPPHPLFGRFTMGGKADVPPTSGNRRD